MTTQNDRQVRFTRACAVCGSDTEHEVVYEKWGVPIVRCAGCGLGSSLLETPHDIVSIYNEGYFQGDRVDGYADYAGSEAVIRAEFRKDVALLRRYGKPGGRLLEVGCAYGFLLMEARSYFACKGIEISEAATERCRAAGLNVDCGVVTEPFLKEQGPFDLVVMLDVIEHLENPAEVLTLLWEALAEGGVLLITTGDWATLTARLMGKHWRLMTPPQHLWFFSRSTLQSLLTRIGFRVVHSARPWKIVPLGLALYQLSSRLRLSVPALQRLNGWGIPVNLFDTIRIIAQK